MAEMSDEEALAHMERERASNDRTKHKFYGSLENAYLALKEKVERDRNMKEVELAEALKKAKSHEDNHFEGKCPTCGQSCACPPKPKRPSLRSLEDHFRSSVGHIIVARSSEACNSVADILRALDEKVVPWLHKLRRGGSSEAIDMLLALGEYEP